MAKEIEHLQEVLSQAINNGILEKMKKLQEEYEHNIVKIRSWTLIENIEIRNFIQKSDPF